MLASVVVNWRREERGASGAEVAIHFGLVGKTMLTLLKSCLGGTDWGDAGESLMHTSYMYAAISTGYVASVILALLNTVAGILCGRPLECLAGDKEVQFGDDVVRRKKFERELEAVFRA